jgi:HPt (histidine-containing phosphotransfer) domain-containing protein
MSHDTIFSLNDALARVDHDRELLQTLAALFVEQGPKDFAAIQAAMAVQDPVALARSAHRLKGALLQFCAPAALAATRELEALGKAGNLEAAEEVCARLETELHRLLTALQHLLDKGFPS